MLMRHERADVRAGTPSLGGLIELEMVSLRPEGAYLRSKMVHSRAEKADMRPKRAALGPVRFEA